MSDLLDLEHTSGLRPIGEYPSHCAQCQAVHDQRERQASCPHETIETVYLPRLLCDDFQANKARCSDCGSWV